jgi:hypothetical protein
MSTTQDPLAAYLAPLPLDQLLLAYDKLDKKGKDLKAMRQLCLVDLFYLMIRVCGRDDMRKPWVLDRCREVEASPDGHIDLWAREHYKSSIITFGLTLQSILRNPNITFGFFSEKFSIASGFLVQIKSEFEKNARLKKLFPDILYADPVKQAPKWNTSEIVVKRPKNPKEATITAQGLNSLRVGAHYDVMVYDDVITDRSVTSPEMVLSITQQFQESLSMSKEGGKKRYIGTRWSHADTYQHILDEGMAEPRIHPATDDGTPSGTPVLFSPEYWELKLIENTPYILACQYLQNPTAGSEKTFDLNDLRWWDVRPFSLSVYILGDPGRKKTAIAADTAFVVVGVDPGKHLFLLDGYCHKMSLTERWNNLSTLYERWKTTPGITSVHVAYETYGSGAADVEYFQEQMSKGIQSQYFEIQELTHTIKGQESKNSRIERMEPDLKRNYICVPYDVNKDEEHPGHPTRLQAEAMASGRAGLISKPIRIKRPEGVYDLTDIFVNQLDKFPFGGKVDLIDAFSRIYDCNIRAPASLVNRYGRTVTRPRRKFSGQYTSAVTSGRKSGSGFFNRGVT